MALIEKGLGIKFLDRYLYLSELYKTGFSEGRLESERNIILQKVVGRQLW